jgi:hypothetical protein
MMRRARVVVERRSVSLTRMMIAVVTCGLSLPFIGLRRVWTTTVLERGEPMWRWRRNTQPVVPTVDDEDREKRP